MEKIVKIVSGEDEETLERIARVYSTIIEAGIYRAPSIKVAESAKLVENIQRDVNIALMNELALIFDRLGINTVDVLSATKTKWNFLPFTPGLVGGNCISVDPYYLAELAQAKGCNPQVILASRRTNNSVGDYLAQKLIELLSKHQEIPLKLSRVGILGVTFKENVRDISNSLVPQIVKKLEDFGIYPLVHDSFADPQSVKNQYGIELVSWKELQNLDALILAVKHKQYTEMTMAELLGSLKNSGIFMDVKSVLDPQKISKPIIYWSL
jgi:UDP-N-acetyl-D-galactosamine dehydrogenase